MVTVRSTLLDGLSTPIHVLGAGLSLRLRRVLISAVYLTGLWRSWRSALQRMTWIWPLTLMGMLESGPN